MVVSISTYKAKKRSMIKEETDQKEAMERTETIKEKVKAKRKMLSN